MHQRNCAGRHVYQETEGEMGRRVAEEEEGGSETTTMTTTTTTMMMICEIPGVDEAAR